MEIEMALAGGLVQGVGSYYNLAFEIPERCPRTQENCGCRVVAKALHRRPNWKWTVSVRLSRVLPRHHSRRVTNDGRLDATPALLRHACFAGSLQRRSQGERIRSARRSRIPSSSSRVRGRGLHPSPSGGMSASEGFQSWQLVRVTRTGPAERSPPLPYPAHRDRHEHRPIQLAHVSVV